MKFVIERLAVFNKYKFLLYNLVIKDFKLKYRRSVLGILWSMLNPLLMMLVITAVFANIFRFDDEWFAVYYLTGWLIFNLVIEGTMGAMGSIMGSSGLINKVYLPKYLFPLQKCLFAAVNTLFAMVPIFVVMLVLRFPIPITVLLFWAPILYALIFAIGLGLILATLSVFFRDITHLYSVWTTAWMFLTPIIYPVELLPAQMQRNIRFNPLYHFVRMFRDVMMEGNVPGLSSHLICMGIAGGFLVVGLAVFKWKQARFVLYM